MVIATIISQYLKDNRRLIIPQLGALLVKEPDHKVVFSQLLKRDDGVLKSLIIAQGASEIEALAIINRLTFDIRYTATSDEKYLLEGVGEFCVDPAGVVHFTDVSDIVVATPEEELSLVVDEPTIEPVAPVVEQPVAKVEPQISMAFDPDLEGLSYNNGSKRRPAKGGIDVWMLLAIVVAVVALGAILYGFLREGADFSVSDQVEQAEYYTPQDTTSMPQSVGTIEE